jgi:polysaccharide deacetylase 2 family uncharacterized protein YibQ
MGAITIKQEKVLFTIDERSSTDSVTRFINKRLNGAKLEAKVVMDNHSSHHS